MNHFVCLHPPHGGLLLIKSSLTILRLLFRLALPSKLPNTRQSNRIWMLQPLTIPLQHWSEVVRRFLVYQGFFTVCWEPIQPMN